MPKNSGCNCARCVRLVEGYLDQRMQEGKPKKRWVVLRVNCGSEEGALQLRIYKKKDEKVTAELHAISKGTFIGTEKGRVYTKKNGMTTPYWAIILKSTTVIFQQPEGKEKEDDEETTISQWYDAVKAKFTMENWLVNPLRGVHGYADGSSVTLSMFITTHRIGLAGTTPPLKCCEEWEFQKIKDCKAFGNVLDLYVEPDSQSQHSLGALAYREIQLRMPSIPDAKRAKDVIDRLSPPKTSGTVLDVPPPPGGRDRNRYTPSPNAPRKAIQPLATANFTSGRRSDPLPPLPSRNDGTTDKGMYSYATADDQSPDTPGTNFYIDPEKGPSYKNVL